MTSKERLLKVLNGELPDRVPISTYELCGFNSKAFENNQPSYKSLMDYIRENTDSITMYDPGQKPTLKSALQLKNYRYKRWDENGFHIEQITLKTPKKDLVQVCKHNDTVMTTWKVEHFCKDSEDIDAYMSMPFVPAKYDFSDYKRIKKELGDKGIVMSTIPDPICEAMELIEFGEGTVWAYCEPEHFKKTLDELHSRQMINLKNMLETQVVDMYRVCGPEYATPPYMPPEFFKKYVYPYLCEITDLIHSYGAKVRIHSHGKIGQVLDMIIDSGADATDPCEAPPDGDITLAEAKKRAGGKLTIFGNIELKLLENGTPDEVRKEVIKCMERAKDGGRYVIMPTASPINIPLSPKTEENYKVFIDTALEYGKY